MAISWIVQTPPPILIGTFLAASTRYRGFVAEVAMLAAGHPFDRAHPAHTLPRVKCLLDATLAVGVALPVTPLKAGPKTLVDV